MTNQTQDISNTNDVLVKVEGLSKKFCKDLKTSLWYGVKDLVSGVRGNKHNRELRPKEFWAVKDVSFELRRGECLGLIGHNGAGKSTLLKILNGLINPDAGKVTIKGRVGALIELGAGFNPILTGRENIYNNGAVLGFTRQEITRKLDDIIAFAELEDFIDMPVQHYSSGMKVRLGFAVAAQMEPDVLIIDEVLAVGDLGFVLKCFKQIDTILPNTAIVFVSHSMPMISRICNHIILMEHGKPKFQGTDVAKGIDLYYTRFANNESNVVFDDGSLEFLSHNCDLEQGQVLRGQDIGISLCFAIKKGNFKVLPTVYMEIKDKDLRPVAGVQSGQESTEVKDAKYLKYYFTIKNSMFTLGAYGIDIIVKDAESNSPILRVNNFIKFSAVGDKSMWVPFELQTDVAVELK
ncbi:ABC transporter ATP-binding protein [Mangrovimonas spongiae]|uniref:ABC transporter ATP-binding protein n=1 Tax=Mangrovimonas spongiae TaxID=2494697 RepID=A0A428K281_9FLAO|nr:ABC transporter ATP-binding protein [Mangrovimonas spongiae]RSK40522.1 ABC transporter ATP-binding protein [Mangrovimonas spongiae]